MASRIAGITVEIDGDTTGLSKALSSINTDLKSTSSQLKDVEKLLKLDPTNTELLAQKQKLLAEAVEETKEKLETLKTASEQANQALEEGTISQEQYDALQREIIETEEKLKDLEEQAEQPATALASIMTRLGNNTSGCRDTLEEYGVTVYDTEGNVQSISSILEGMQDVWAGLTDEEKSNLSYVVAGKTAQAELMTVLGESTGSFEAYREGLASCSGTAEEMAAIMQDNLEGQLTILKSQLEELAISFGEMLMPVVMNVVSALQDLVT